MDNETAKLLFARANEFKEGDLWVGGTGDDVIRKDAKREISAMKIGDIAKLAFVEDAVSEALSRSINRLLLNEIASLAVGEVKGILTGTSGSPWVSRYSAALPSEVIAALVKTMSNEELSLVSRSIFNILPEKTSHGSVVVGSARHFGSRIQPNSPGDSDDEILISVLEGLTYGCGDVIIGLNPASDDIETIIRTEQLLQSIVERLQLPTRYCVLSDMVKQTAARAQTKVDVGFQSLAGTSKALVSMLGLDTGREYHQIIGLYGYSTATVRSDDNLTFQQVADFLAVIRPGEFGNVTVPDWPGGDTKSTKFVRIRSMFDYDFRHEVPSQST